MWELILPLLAFLIAAVGAFTGLGGGVFFVPLLTLAIGIVPAHAVGTSLFAMVFGGFGATLIFARQKRVYFRVGLLLALATAPGAILGAYLTSVLPGQVLGLVFGVFLTVVAVRMISVSRYLRRNNAAKMGSRLVACERDCFADKKRLAAGVGFSFFAGLASGLLGISGGVLLVPILALLVFVPIHEAIGTAMFLMMVTSLFGLAQHFTLGNIDFTYALLLAPGAFVGASFGAWVCKKISADKLGLVFAVALILVSIQMIIRFI